MNQPLQNQGNNDMLSHNGEPYLPNIRDYSLENNVNNTTPPQETERIRGKISGVDGHLHDGADLPLQDIRDIGGFIECLDATPTKPPKSFWEQFKIVDNAGTPELYFYNYKLAAWKKVT